MNNAYFDALYKPVMENLVSYRDDFLISDKELLADFTGEFMLACRASGTNLLKLCPDYIKGASKPISFAGIDGVPTIEQLDINVDAFFFRNDIYFHGVDGEVRQVSKSEAIGLYKSFRWRSQIKSFLGEQKKAA